VKRGTRLKISCFVASKPMIRGPMCKQNAGNLLDPETKHSSPRWNQQKRYLDSKLKIIALPAPVYFTPFNIHVHKFFIMYCIFKLSFYMSVTYINCYIYINYLLLS